MKNLILTSGSLPKIIHIPRSKSYANRLLILAALDTKKKKLKFLPLSTDVTNLISALEKIGIEFHFSDDGLEVLNSFPDCEKKIGNDIITVSVGEGGTTARFLAALILLGSKKYQLKLGHRLKNRPWKEFLDLAEHLGAKVSLQDDILFIQGPVKIKNNITVDCSKTTQFASGLQMICSHFGLKVEPQNLSSSKTYWELTEKLIERFQNCEEFEVSLDWSSASYGMCFAALNHEVFFPSLKYDPLQSDAKLLRILSDLECVRLAENGIYVFPFKQNKSLHIDVEDCLDLVPSLAFLLSHISGEHVLKGIENLVHKESDRLSEIIKLLADFDRSAKRVNDSLIINGHSKKISTQKSLILPDDHRMVMVGALFLRHHAGGEISPAEAVEKSYPDFFNLFK